MASLYIKDPETAEHAARLAEQLGVSKTDVVRRGLIALETQLSPDERRRVFRDRIAKWRAENPLPPPTGLKADKAFYDWLSGEEDV
ncbi:MAG: type II toxin-antitoxin system VapB family antitoxin [Sphingomonas paucimobilis]